MTKGKVKWYNETKGFGFIETENGKDIFFHRNGLVSPYGGLDNDEEVVFETKEGPKGLYAVNIKSAK
jgi:CspA family cold shock protein